MTAYENDEFELGEEVTSVAKSKARGGSAVVAVRLSVEDIAEIESICEATGKSLSQVLREAIRIGLRHDTSPTLTVTISTQDGITTTTGAFSQYGQAAVAEKKDEQHLSAA